MAQKMKLSMATQSVVSSQGLVKNYPLLVINLSVHITFHLAIILTTPRSTFTSK